MTIASSTRDPQDRSISEKFDGYNKPKRLIEAILIPISTTVQQLPKVLHSRPCHLRVRYHGHSDDRTEIAPLCDGTISKKEKKEKKGGIGCLLIGARQSQFNTTQERWEHGNNAAANKR